MSIRLPCVAKAWYCLCLDFSGNGLAFISLHYEEKMVFSMITPHRLQSLGRLHLNCFPRSCSVGLLPTARLQLQSTGVRRQISNLSPWQKFFSSFLRSKPVDYANTFNGQEITKASYDLWSDICSRLDVAPIHSPLEPTYSAEELDEAVEMHFENRAALVLDESRQAISDGLEQWVEKPSQFPFLKAKVSRKNDFHVYEEVYFKKVSSNNKEEKKRKSKRTPKLRPGTILACIKSGESPDISNVRLAAVFPPSKDFESDSKPSDFSAMFCDRISARKGTWDLYEIATLLNDERKFEACTNSVSRKVRFIDELLQAKQGERVSARKFGWQPFTSVASSSELFIKVNRLNKVQENAATQFLSAPEGSMTLVQG